MIQLIYQGQYGLFIMILIALIISLSFHEFGHAYVARYFGDDTAERAGRLTINPLAHIDPMGLMMVVFVGFGYAKPVPTNPRNFTSRWAVLLVSVAGPGMNLVVAIVSINFYLAGLHMGWESLEGPEVQFFFVYLAQINLLLMVFNLIPLGALDGHYILPYFLPRGMAQKYRDLNARFGNMVLLGLVVLSIMGVPVFQNILGVSRTLLPLIAFF